MRPQRVLDAASGETHEGWLVLVTGSKIAAVGPAPQVKAAAVARTIDLPGMTLLPGLIDAHSHVFLHPYDETLWNDQVLKEPLAYRTVLAVNHSRATLMAGFTTLRDLGTEGAGYADVGLKQAIDQGIIPGPRLLVTTKAISGFISLGVIAHPIAHFHRGTCGKRQGYRLGHGQLIPLPCMGESMSFAVLLATSDYGFPLTPSTAILHRNN